MRISTLAGSVLAALLTMSWLGTPHVTAEGRHQPTIDAAAPAELGDAGERPAAEVLAEVRAAFDAEAGVRPPPGARTARTPLSAGRDMTLLLRDLRLVLGRLDDADRALAESYLARPTDDDDPFGITYGRHPTSSTCDGEVCVHWARTGRHAPVGTTTEAIPEQVHRTVATAAEVWDEVVIKGGYRAPIADGGGAGVPGNPDPRLDIFLADIGDQGLYGYCQPETPESSGHRRSYSGYCVLDNDYSSAEFPHHTPLENLQVTLAHEFFHAVQFGYDTFADTWFMESTATWLEDEIYDDVDDNRAYLAQSPLTQPRQALDDPYARYGSWIWWRYLTERFPERSGESRLAELVKDVWDRADRRGARGAYSIPALATALATRGTSLPRELAGFGVANMRPRQFYEEGRAYPRAPALRTHRLTADRPTTERTTLRMMHLSNATVAFVPRKGTARAGSRLRVAVRVPAAVHHPVLTVTVRRTDGKVARRVVQPTVRNRAVTTKFSQRLVSRVEITLSNGGHAYRCDRGSFWSCGGAPKDDGRAFTYLASFSKAKGSG